MRTRLNLLRDLRAVFLGGLRDKKLSNARVKKIQNRESAKTSQPRIARLPRFAINHAATNGIQTFKDNENSF
jgi:hypothetical protein